MSDEKLHGNYRGWADRVADGMAKAHPDFTYANLAIRGKLVMKESSKIMTFMEMVLMFGRIREFILVNGKKIRCTELVQLLGLMDENIQGLEFIIYFMH